MSRGAPRGATAAALALLGSLAVAGVGAGAAAGPPPSGQLDELKRRLQAVLDGVAASHDGTPVQLGWKSDAFEFTLAAGEVRVPGGLATRQTTADDTFLFGSGVKPFTAAAVMALRDAGALDLDDPLERHVDPALGRLKAGSTLRGLFGPSASRITVGHMLQMRSGIQDFDFPPFDNLLLRANETYRTHSPLEFVEYASTQQPALVCEPGTCVSYSSNNFVLAGFVLLTHAKVANWWELDLAAFLPTEESRASLGKSFFFQKELLNKHLTVPGRTGGGWAKTPELTIWNQSSSILGWTCGNLVATAGDVARFMWDLLGPTPAVLPAATVRGMQEFKPLDLGWAKGEIQYGTGLMIESVRLTPGRPPALPEWGTYLGHGGDTFGFLSEQGIISGIGAAVSIVAAQDTDGLIVKGQAFCHMIKVAAEVLKNQTVSWPCVPLGEARDGAWRGTAAQEVMVV